MNQQRIFTATVGPLDFAPDAYETVNWLWPGW